MDGTNAAFLLDTPFLSGSGAGPRNGILYIEDFDAALPPQTPPPPAAPEMPKHVITEDDLRTAFAAGQEQGLAAALADEHLLQAQLRTAALDALSHELAQANASLKALADAHAEEAARVVLAVLQAAVPATMRAHAPVEIQGVIAALLPGLRCEPELRVRAHPLLADLVRESLVAQLPAEGCVLSVSADASMAEPDVRIAWKDGHGLRDTAAIWAAISVALAPLNLPHLKDIDHGQ